MNSKRFLILASACMVIMCASYLLFLAASWNQFQEDRARRDIKINELLERIPKPAPKASDDKPVAE